MNDAPTWRRHWRRADVLVATLCLNVVGLALPMSMLHVYDRVLGSRSVSTLVFLALIVLSALVLEAVFRIARAWVHAGAAARFDHRTSRALFDRILARGPDRGPDNGVSDLAEPFRDVSRVRDFYFGPAGTAALDVPFAVIAFGLIISIAGWLALVPIVIIAVLAMCGVVVAQLTFVETGAQRALDRRRSNFLYEALRGAHTVKALAIEAGLIRRHERLQGASGRAVQRVTLWHGVAQSIGQTSAGLMTASIVAIGAVFALRGELSMGGLAATTMLAGRMMQPLVGGVSAWTRYEGVREADRRLHDELARPVPISQDIAHETIEGRIFMDRVSFSYGDEATPILDEAVFMAPAHSIVSIVGEAASGRRTFMRLLAGELRPTSGAIYIDDVRVTPETAGALKKHVSFITSTDGLLAGSILENITMFRTGEVEERALAAIEAVGLKEIVGAMPRGLDTQIGGANTAALSPGVAQRIRIARGLVDDPSVILFDGGNSNLDIVSDRVILDLIRSFRRKKTVVMTSSRPSYLAICDMVYTLADGQLTRRTEPDPNAHEPRSTTSLRLRA